MKTNHPLIVAAALAILPVAALAGWFSHDQPPANALPLSGLIKQIEDAGYKTIVEIRFKDGAYEVEAFDASGKEIELEVDPLTGKVSQDDD